MQESGGGGGRGPGSGEGGGGGGGGGEGDDEAADVSAALARAGLEAEQVSADVLAALAEGRIGAKELSNWAKVLEQPLSRLLAHSSYIRDRLLAAPSLMSVIRIEIAVGCISTIAAEKAARGERFLYELDFVLANQALIVLTNLALVCALAPVAPVMPPPTPGTLAAWYGALPGFFLESGAYTASQRAACFFSTAAQFSLVGAVTSSIGQALTLSLAAMRTRLNPDDPPNVELAPIAPTAKAFAQFMAVSTNTRYQTLNSIEAHVFPILPGGKAVATASRVVLRTYNNYLGSANWIWWARQCELQ